MNKLSMYLFAVTILCSHYAFSMEEKKEETIKIEIEQDITEEKVEIIIKEKPLRVISLASSDDQETIHSISVDEQSSTALYVVQDNYSGAFIIRWHNLIDNKCIKEFALDDEYKVFSEGVITINGPLIIVVKKEHLKKGSKPFYHVNIETEEIDEIDCTLWEADQPCFFDDNSSINSQSGLWKAIAIPNTKNMSRIVLCNDEHKVISTFYENSATSIKTYLSRDADCLINGISHDDGTWSFNLYTIVNKMYPTLSKVIKSTHDYLYFSQKNNYFSDYKKIYNGVTGDLIESPKREDDEYIIGFSDIYRIVSNKTKKTITRYNAINETKTMLEGLSTDFGPMQKALFINKHKEIAVFSSCLPDISLYNAPEQYIQEKQGTTSYFFCSIL